MKTKKHVVSLTHKILNRDSKDEWLNGELPYVTVDRTPGIAEEPFITLDTDGKYYRNIPKVSHERVGFDYETLHRVGFEFVYVADAEKDAAESMLEMFQLSSSIVASSCGGCLIYALSVARFDSNQA